MNHAEYVTRKVVDRMVGLLERKHERMWKRIHSLEASVRALKAANAVITAALAVQEEA